MSANVCGGGLIKNQGCCFKGLNSLESFLISFVFISLHHYFCAVLAVAVVSRNNNPKRREHV